jgi:hypothetical protein
MTTTDEQDLDHKDNSPVPEEVRNDHDTDMMKDVVDDDKGNQVSSEKVEVATDTEAAGDVEVKKENQKPSEMMDGTVVDNDDDDYIDELNESRRENDVSMTMTDTEGVVDGQGQQQQQQQQTTKRVYQKRRTPILKWKDVEKEMKAIIYDQVIILWYQLEKKRQTSLKGKLTRQRMARMILVTLDEPPFLNRQRIYNVINKHTKVCEENGTDPFDCTQLVSIPKIFEALDDLHILLEQEQQKQQQRSPKKRSSYGSDDDDDDENSDVDSDDDKHKKKKMTTKQHSKRGGGGTSSKLKEMTIVKGKKTYMKTKGPTTMSTTTTGISRTGIVTKEMKKSILKKSVDMYLAKKDKISSTTSSGIPRALVTDILESLGQPRWLTRNDIYTAIHNYNKKRDANDGDVAATKKTSIGTKKATFSSTNTTTIIKREKLTSTQKRARLEEAIELATKNYAIAKQEVHPNRLQDSVVKKIIHSAIEHVRLPPKFSVLITPMSLRNRLSRQENNQNSIATASSTAAIATTTTASTKSETTVDPNAPSAVELLVAEVDSALLSAAVPTSTSATITTTTAKTSVEPSNSNENDFF